MLCSLLYFSAKKKIKERKKKKAKVAKDDEKKGRGEYKIITEWTMRYPLHADKSRGYESG